MKNANVGAYSMSFYFERYLFRLYMLKIVREVGFAAHPSKTLYAYNYSISMSLVENFWRTILLFFFHLLHKFAKFQVRRCNNKNFSLTLTVF